MLVRLGLELALGGWGGGNQKLKQSSTTCLEGKWNNYRDRLNNGGSRLSDILFKTQ